MNRWQQIERIYHSALELEESQRVAFLEKACAGDEALRQEVESLLRSEQSGDRFIEEPALEVVAKMVAQEEPQSLLGQQLGSYQVLSLLGAGGMGVVYKARDARLKRFVAIKVLPADQVSDPERKRRFIQEAQAASALNHQGGQLFPEANSYNIIPQMYFDGVPNQPSLYTGSRLPADQGYNRFHFTDNFSWIRGAHTLKFGLYFERSWATDGPAANCFNGCFNFGRDPNNPGYTGWAFASALLGNFDSYGETNARPRYQGTNKIVEWFAQDTWKATRKLTLTYGMRFSGFTPWYMSKGTGATFQEAAYDPSQVPPLYRPVIGPNGQRVAQDPTTGHPLKGFVN